MPEGEARLVVSVVAPAEARGGGRGGKGADALRPDALDHAWRGEEAAAREGGGAKGNKMRQIMQ